jgi:hypothetical protein
MQRQYIIGAALTFGCGFAMGLAYAGGLKAGTMPVCVCLLGIAGYMMRDAFKKARGTPAPALPDSTSSAQV